MKVKSVIEREDGGADVIIEDLQEWELKILIQEGFVTLLSKMADEEKKKYAVPSLLRKEEK